MPSTPSQKSIDVCRSAPVMVMWCTPWLWSFRITSVSHERGLVVAALERPPRDELDPGLHEERRPQPRADGGGEVGVGAGVTGQFHVHTQRRRLGHARP